MNWELKDYIDAVGDVMYRLADHVVIKGLVVFCGLYVLGLVVLMLIKI